MKGVFSAPGDYIHFKSQVPLHKIPIGSKLWRYYDFGPKEVPPLVCLPGTAETADVYYKQIMSLSMKGYRVISVDIPHVWNHHEWIQAFEKFLDAIDVHHVHLYGTSLGGFLAQLFAQYRPRRVKSLVLSNSFLDTRSFSAAMPWVPMVKWAPSFLLKRYVLTGIRDGPHEPFIADSVDFVVSQVETLKREDLASRLTLTVDSATVGPLLLSDSFITIMDTNDYCATPQQLKDQLSEKYPGARRASMKSGGDFPFLSRPDEVNLYLQLHLRRVGVEARPDLVRGSSKDNSEEGSSKENDKRDDYDDPPPGDGGSPSPPSQDPPPGDGGSPSPPSQDQLPPSDIMDSQNLDEHFNSERDHDLPKDGGGSLSTPSENNSPASSNSVNYHNLNDMLLKSKNYQRLWYLVFLVEPREAMQLGHPLTYVDIVQLARPLSIVCMLPLYLGALYTRNQFWRSRQFV
ncbi:Maspardin [Thalictrum thalictroides]|uniref:Maspardin n=1 Tax=Thalictrum thalictroides TaxID=46969 RepID=A0A7J6V8H3_THATH|nr:Maspardin [Thalictrum thalictroides]